MTPSWLRFGPVRDRSDIGGIRSSTTAQRDWDHAAGHTCNARLAESLVRLINRFLTQSYQSGRDLSFFFHHIPIGPGENAGNQTTTYQAGKE
jgi:hypothetical protein